MTETAETEAEARYSFTRAEMVSALARLEARPVLLPGRDRPVTPAESMADAIIEALGEAGECPVRSKGPATGTGPAPGHRSGRGSRDRA